MENSDLEPDSPAALGFGSGTPEEISKQLSVFAKSAEISVDNIDIVYYDDDGQFAQPTYRFVATIHRLPAERDSLGVEDSIVGYVPYAKGIAPVPVLDQAGGDHPSETCRDTDLSPKSHPQGSSISVGRYVIQNDTNTWVANASNFMDSLNSSVSGPHFDNAQYCWARRSLFTVKSNQFINAVVVGLVEAHGNWWYFQTQSGDADNDIHIDQDIGSPGYGPVAGGSLSYWILHSCEVIPSPDDTARWSEPWWNVFGGLRSVVGYRTKMHIYDGAEKAFGASLGKLAPVVSAWLGDVIVLSEYSKHTSAIGHDGHSHPEGRPSTVSACGHDQDSVFSTGEVKAAKCLSGWWFAD